MSTISHTFLQQAADEASHIARMSFAVGDFANGRDALQLVAKIGEKLAKIQQNSVEDNGKVRR